MRTPGIAEATRAGRRLIALLSGGLVALVPGGLAAQKLPVGPEFRVNEQAYGDQGKWRGPDVARGAGGGFVVVWDGYGDTSGGRRFDAAGAPLGPDFTFATDPVYVDDPAVDADANGNFVVVWQDNALDPDAYAMAARRFDSNGAPVGAPFQVNTETSGGPRNPKVAVQPDGNFMVVWGQFHTSYFGISGRLFDSTGSPTTAEFAVDTAVGDSDGYNGIEEDDDGIEIAAGAAGNFMVVWQYYEYPLGFRILGRLFDSAGTAAGPPFQVSTNPNVGAYPGIAADGQGNFVVAWGEYGDVYARRFDSAGTALGSDFKVNTVSSDIYATYVKLDADAAGNFVVVWGSYEDIGPRVRVRQFDSTGNAQPGEFVLSQTIPPGYSYPFSAEAPDVGFTGGGNFVVAWRSYMSTDYPPADDGDEIVAQRFGDPAGPCSPAPKTTCHGPVVPRRGVFRFTESSNPERSTLVWRWVKGDATDVAELGDPRTDTSYALCVYDASGNPQPVFRAEAPFDGTCGDLPCWTRVAHDTAFQYRDDPASGGGSTNPDGIRRLRAQSGAAGQASVLLQARATNLALPAGPLTLPVAVQLQASSGACWTATYDAFVSKNEDGKFRARPGSPSGAFLD